MRIYLASDLHTEFGNKAPRLETPVDVVVLAGDVATGVKAVDVACFYRDSYNVPVILLAGNHEYYGGEIRKTLLALREEAKAQRDIHFLERDAVAINGVRFLGATLWTDFSSAEHYISKFVMAQSVLCIADFSVIRNGDTRFHPRDAEALFEQSYAWLECELAKPFEGKTVVVTHFAPHHAAAHPAFAHAGPPHDELNAYFLSDCSALMRDYSIDAWLFGHTHYSVDVVVEGRTRLIANQRGYPREREEQTQFDPQKTIVI